MTDDGRDGTLWGLHMPPDLGRAALAEGFVAIGWREEVDPTTLASRDDYKAVAVNWGRSAGAVAAKAGIMYRFVHAMREGDLVVHPSKDDRTLNLGRIEGPARYDPAWGRYSVRRAVAWIAEEPRTAFPQAVLNEVGSKMTLFAVRNNRAALLTAMGQAAPAGPDEEEAADDVSETRAVSEQAEETTADFVIRRIMDGLDGHTFEHLVAHLLECMGYTARVTVASGDGGVDVIAHKDPLGFEPPIVKVQCKRTTTKIGRPDVDRLLGTLGEGEFGLFVSLGSYTPEAVSLERNRPKLRLIDGEALVAMVLASYPRLAPRWRTFLPLRQIFVPDPGGG